MEKTLEILRNDIKQWWWFFIAGLLSFGTGIVILAYPISGYVSLSILFSLVIACSGISHIFFAFSVREIMRGWGWTLMSGIIDTAIGVYLLMYPVVTMATLPYFVGFYMVFRSFYIIGASIDLKTIGLRGWGWLLAGGISLLALGFLTIDYPSAGVAFIVAASGYAFIVSGIVSMMLAFQLKNFKNQLEKLETSSARVTLRTEQHRHA